MDTTADKLLRALPAVGGFLASAAGQRLSAEYGEGMTKWQLRDLLGTLRAEIGAGRLTAAPTAEELAARLATHLRRASEPVGRQAINATGILLHTGLGRAPLCPRAIEAIRAAAGATPLQASLDSGDRSLREQRVERMLCELVGCEAATVVNNNAAATMLTLHTLAVGREAVISRGQLIEIGGSFRMTDVMAQSGAVLREVGTTNRTHLRDYEAALNDQTAALVHVHTSNYRVRGFAGTPGIAELVALGQQHGLRVLDDLGSGAFVPLREWGLSDEPLVRDSLAAGSDVVWFSGDKLIGGPQAGIICGRKDLIEKIRKDPFARMFRVCKLTLAGLEATLVEFINGTFRETLPLYQMLAKRTEALEDEGRRMVQNLIAMPGVNAELAHDVAYIGSGSIPDEGLPTRVVTLRHERLSAGDLAKRLRLGSPSVFARLADREVIFDLRTLRKGEAAQVVEAVRHATRNTQVP